VIHLIEVMHQSLPAHTHALCQTECLGGTQQHLTCCACKPPGTSATQSHPPFACAVSSPALNWLGRRETISQ
jgi:hypothetical protein